MLRNQHLKIQDEFCLENFSSARLQLFRKIEWLENTTPISKEDIKAMIPTVEQELKDAEANKETKKASGKQKLKDLGLDDDEIQALIGV